MKRETANESKVMALQLSYMITGAPNGQSVRERENVQEVQKQYPACLLCCFSHNNQKRLRVKQSA
jgi:hypothetical protein